MKTEFDLGSRGPYTGSGKVKIIGVCPKWSPYVSINLESNQGLELSACIKDRDLERFAVNILKALKSKRLAP